MLRREHLEKFLIAVPIFFFFFTFRIFTLHAIQFLKLQQIQSWLVECVQDRRSRDRFRTFEVNQNYRHSDQSLAFTLSFSFCFFLSFFFFVLSSLDFIQARELPFLLRFDSSASEHSAFFSFRYEPTLHLSVLSDKSVFVAVSTKFHAREKKSGSDTYPFLFHPISVGFSDRSLRTTE